MADWLGLPCVRRASRIAICATIAMGMTATAVAGVRTTTEYRSYSVSGTTAKALVSYMKRNPFRGDRGHAVANVRPYYRLSVATKSSGGTCRASTVTLNIRFVMTLPNARSESSMAASTRSAWRSFVSFAKRHESVHRSSYIGCGNAFVAKAQRMTNKSCEGLQAQIRRQLEADKSACERKQVAFDRREYGRINGLSLFQMVRSR